MLSFSTSQKKLGTTRAGDVSSASTFRDRSVVEDRSYICCLKLSFTYGAYLCSAPRVRLARALCFALGLGGWAGPIPRSVERPHPVILRGWAWLYICSFVEWRVPPLSLSPSLPLSQPPHPPPPPSLSLSVCLCLSLSMKEWTVRPVLE